MGGDDDRPADRRGGERDGTDDLLEEQLRRRGRAPTRRRACRGEAARPRRPRPRTRAGRRTSRRTSRTAGSSTYRPRSIAAADARLARHQSPLRKTPSNSEPITTSAARFGHRCPKPRCTRCPETSRQYSPFSMASRSIPAELAELVAAGRQQRRRRRSMARIASQLAESANGDSGGSGNAVWLHNHREPLVLSSVRLFGR